MLQKKVYLNLNKYCDVSYPCLSIQYIISSIYHVWSGTARSGLCPISGGYNVRAIISLINSYVNHE